MSEPSLSERVQGTSIEGGLAYRTAKATKAVDDLCRFLSAHRERFVSDPALPVQQIGLLLSMLDAMDGASKEQHRDYYRARVYERAGEVLGSLAPMADERGRPA